MVGLISPAPIGFTSVGIGTPLHDALRTKKSQSRQLICVGGGGEGRTGGNGGGRQVLARVSPLPFVLRQVVVLVLQRPAAAAVHLLVAVQADLLAFSL